jgi:hypothetical protein
MRASQVALCTTGAWPLVNSGSESVGTVSDLPTTSGQVGPICVICWAELDLPVPRAAMVRTQRATPPIVRLSFSPIGAVLS